MIKDGICDMVSLIMTKQTKFKFINTTHSYASDNHVLITRIDQPFISNLNNLSNQKIGINKGYINAIIYVKSLYPNLNIIELEHLDLKRINSGEFYGYIGTSYNFAYKIAKGYSHELKIMSKIGDMKIDGSFGVRESEPMLLSILNKALNDIPSVEKLRIANSWLSINVEEQFDYILFWQIITPIFIIIIVLIFLYIKQRKLNHKNEYLNSRLEKQVQKEEEQKKIFKTLFVDSADGMSIIKDDKFIDCNKSVLNLLKLDCKEDFLYTHPTDFSPKFQPDGQSSIEKAKDVLKTTIEKGINNFEWVHLNANSEEFWVDITLTIMVLNNENVIHVVWRDISDKKQLEKELKKKEQELFKSEKLASMGEMIGNIAHQWRQPLSVISTGVTGLKLQKEYNILTDEELNQTCDAINDNVQYLSKTIDDFKGFIKGDRTKKIFSLKNQIASFLNLVAGSIKSEDINMILDLQEDIKIDGYENELTQCLINIFYNAKDVLVEKQIEDKLVFLSTSIINDKVIIKIKDNACGIPEDIINKIFEPYFTTKHQSQGTGLGLHMTYNLIVDGMGGSIEVENLNYDYDGKEYTGAEFKIILPLS